MKQKNSARQEHARELLVECTRELLAGCAREPQSLVERVSEPHARTSCSHAHAPCLGTNHHPLVKFCGLRRAQDVALSNELRPDLVGFIVDYPPSRRSLNETQLVALAGAVSSSIVRVGVFVDASLDLICRLVEADVIDVVQLHGKESEAYIEQLRERVSVAIMQAFCIARAHDVDAAQHSLADIVLLDSGKGSGERFDWSLIQKVRRPYFLAGGLTPKNLAYAIELLHPFGIDISSGIETNGTKDPDKMRAAMAAMRQLTP